MKATIIAKATRIRYVRRSAVGPAHSGVGDVIHHEMAVVRRVVQEGGDQGRLQEQVRVVHRHGHGCVRPVHVCDHEMG